MINSNTRVLLQSTSNFADSVWLELPFDEEEFGEALKSIGIDPEEDENELSDFERLAKGDNFEPKWIVVDYNSDFLVKENFKDIFEASDLVERIEDLNDYDRDTLDALIEDGDTIEEALDAIEDGDVEFYPNTDLTELAEQFYDEGVFSNEFLLNHIDWEGVGRELSFDGYNEVAGGVLRR